MAAQVTDPQAEPGYDIHETRIPFITGVMATLVALMTMSVAARLYARAMLRRVLGWDDWFMLLAWVRTKLFHLSSTMNQQVLLTLLPGLRPRYEHRHLVLDSVWFGQARFSVDQQSAESLRAVREGHMGSEDTIYHQRHSDEDRRLPWIYAPLPEPFVQHLVLPCCHLLLCSHWHLPHPDQHLPMPPYRGLLEIL